MTVNNTTIPNTNITLKEFKELLYKQFKVYPTMQTNYKNNTFMISQTFYDNIDITQRKLGLFCNKLGINYKSDINNRYTKCVVIDLAK